MSRISILYLIGTITGIFAVIGGPLIWGSIQSMWKSSIGPVIIVISGLSFFLAFMLMLFKNSK